MEEKNVIKKGSILSSIIHPKPSNTDPEGSYTGFPVFEDEVPVQDADDL